MKSYKANWEIQGLPEVKTLAPGGIVKLEDETAAGLVACGALSPCLNDASTESASGSSKPAESNSVDLSSMNKAQLVEYAREKLNLTLDINKKKDELLMSIAEAAGK